MQDDLSKSLQTARESLLLGIKLSKQGSYARRAPEAESLPYFGETRGLLEKILKQHPNNREALTMMSQLFESLLDFNAAASFLTRAFDAGEPKTKKSLKRLALLRENAKTWEELFLTPEKLRELGSYLEAKGVGPNHTTMQFTQEWLEINDVANLDKVLAALEQRGAFSDFQVLANVVHG